MNLILEEEIHEIQRIWRMERGDWQNTAYAIYEKVTGEKLEEVVEDLDASEVYGSPVVTEISPLDVFYAAESYHQNYFNQNPNQQYCMFVVGEKVAKARAKFADLMIAE